MRRIPTLGVISASLGVIFELDRSCSTGGQPTRAVITSAGVHSWNLSGVGWHDAAIHACQPQPPPRRTSLFGPQLLLPPAKPLSAGPTAITTCTPMQHMHTRIVSDPGTHARAVARTLARSLAGTHECIHIHTHTHTTLPCTQVTGAPSLICPACRPLITPESPQARGARADSADVMSLESLDLRGASTRTASYGGSTTAPPQHTGKLSTFFGVFVPCVLSIFSVILFLRVG